MVASEGSGSAGMPSLSIPISAFSFRATLVSSGLRYRLIPPREGCEMRCPHGQSTATTERPDRTELGYRRFSCRDCQLCATPSRRFTQRSPRPRSACWGHRNPMSRGLAMDAAEGLEALLATDIPADKPISLAPGVRASIEQAPRCPEGFASYEARRQWVRRMHGVKGTYQTLYTLVRTRVKTTSWTTVGHIRPGSVFFRTMCASCAGGLIAQSSTRLHGSGETSTTS
jgi:hypothetical protein